MTKPKTDIGELQVIQFQIARFIDKYRAEAGTEELVHQLKEAVTHLNSAKTIIFDRLVADGTLRPVEPEDDEK